MWFYFAVRSEGRVKDPDSNHELEPNVEVLFAGSEACACDGAEDSFYRSLDTYFGMLEACAKGGFFWIVYRC